MIEMNCCPSLSAVLNLLQDIESVSLILEQVLSEE